MATFPRKKRCTPQQRQEYVEEFAQSGLSQGEFCRRVKLHPVTFSRWWRHRQLTAPVFAEVQVSAVAPVDGMRRSGFGGAAVLQLVNGARLDLALGTESAWTGLGLMLKTLQS
jgi:hypothetical protein